MKIWARGLRCTIGVARRHVVINPSLAAQNLGSRGVSDQNEVKKGMALIKAKRKNQKPALVLPNAGGIQSNV